ncbi:hypothetical protein G9A89_013832 [Geosiphon pyriformis]|nr:hypothetical protein G9A89_013832 [Geosiphon pyriformis]
MSPPVAYVISTKAYQKLILHASKHPSATVNGVLLGSYTSSDAGNDDTVAITDAVPLFHHWTTLTPMLEVGLQQVDIYAAHHKLRIVGYYHANAQAADKSLPGIGMKIASKIRESFTDAIALVVQNTKLSQDTPEVAVLPYIFKENQWRPVKPAFESESSSSSLPSKFTLMNADAPNLTSKSIKRKIYEYLYDFDEHLENIELDWLEGEILIVSVGLSSHKKLDRYTQETEKLNNFETRNVIIVPDFEIPRTK